MEFWQRLSAAVAIGGPAAVLLYDVIAFACGGRESTITHVIRMWTHSFRELPFLMAGLMLWLWLHLFAEEILRR